MSRKLASIVTLLVLALPALAQVRAGSISGLVRNSSGVPQMGAAVKILAGAAEAMTVFTDAKGQYLAVNLPPGTYQVRASAAAFLPSLRENIALKAGAHLVVNLTLNTLFEAVQLLPARRRTAEEEEDWKWTLRSAANRPILRVVDDTPLLVEAKSGEDHPLTGRVTFLAGGENRGVGSAGDMTTAFSLQSSLFSSGVVSLGGNVGYGEGTPSGIVRAAYTHDFGNGSHPEVALTMRRFAAPGAALRDAALQSIAFSLSDRIAVSNLLEVQYGGEFQSIQFGGHVNAFRPFGAADLHLTPNTVVEYRYATSLPNTRLEKGFDSAPADLSESGPRISLVGGAPLVERARHQELSLSHRFGSTNVQVAAFHDRLRNVALAGVGDGATIFASLLPDVYSSSFSVDGGSLDASGLRVVVQRRILSDLSATLDYAFGGVVEGQNLSQGWQPLDASMFTTAHRHALAGKVAGRVPGARTRVVASYRWTPGGGLTPVDMFNTSAGQADPFLSFFVRQPIPGAGVLPGKLEAVIDLRNLLAQGYVPVMGQDGHTVYLVQSARAVRGGVAFTF